MDRSGQDHTHLLAGTHVHRQQHIPCILSSCSMRKDMHSYTSRYSSLGANETHRDAKICMYCKVMHSHPSREGPYIYTQGGQSRLNTYHKLDSLTQAFPELPAGIQGSGIKDWGGSYILPYSDASIQ